MKHIVSVLQKTLLSNCLSDTDSNSSRSVVMIVLERLTRAENSHKYGDLALMAGYAGALSPQKRIGNSRGIVNSSGGLVCMSLC